MKNFPNQITYSRCHKLKNLKGSKGNSLSIYPTGLRLTKDIYITYDQLESSRKVFSRLTKPRSGSNKKNQKNITQKKKVKRKKSRSKKRKKLLHIRSNICMPITKKPLQVRMGKGKGALDHWVYPARSERVLFEFKISQARRFANKMRVKLPVKTKFVFNKIGLRRETKVIKI